MRFDTSMPTWKKHTFLFWKGANKGPGKASGLRAAGETVHICIFPNLFMFV